MITLLRNICFKDFWLKLFSLALAVLTWLTINFAVQREAMPTGPMGLGVPAQKVFPRLPVVIMSSAEDVRSLSVHPKEVEVTVQGDSRTLAKLQPKDIHVIVDLTGIQAAHDLRKRIEVSTPAGMAHVRVNPEEVQVLFPPRN
jgi:YbbR domain-containing protein